MLLFTRPVVTGLVLISNVSLNWKVSCIRLGRNTHPRNKIIICAIFMYAFYSSLQSFNKCVFPHACLWWPTIHVSNCKNSLCSCATGTMAWPHKATCLIRTTSVCVAFVLLSSDKDKKSYFPTRKKAQQNDAYIVYSRCIKIYTRFKG